MKKQLGFLALISFSMIGGAFAQSVPLCPQAADTYLRLGETLDKCTSVRASTGKEEACRNFCDEANKLIGSTGGGGCTNQEVEGVRRAAIQEGYNQGLNRGLQDGRNEVLADLQVKVDGVSPDYYGTNLSTCGDRARLDSQRFKVESIQKCNGQARTIKNCYIAKEEITGSAGRPPKFTGEGNFKADDNRSSQDECQRKSLAQATQTALERCRIATGSECTINAPETIVTHNIKEPGGLRMGRRDQRICDAKVVAEAPVDLAFKCNLRISARNQAFAN